MFSSPFYAFFLILLPSFTFALPLLSHNSGPVARSARRSFELPLRRTRRGIDLGRYKRDGSVNGSIGLGDNQDLIYTVPIEIGTTTTAIHLDTGSSDLWVISDLCTAGTCENSTAPKVPSASVNSTGAFVTLNYGDSQTGTFAQGPIGTDVATIAGIAMTGQHYAAVNATTNAIVKYGAAGIFGLGFPSGSEIQNAVVNDQFNTPLTTDEFVATTYSNGPLLARMAMTEQLELPMFTITLQRDTVDISGTGTLTVGQLPAGINNDSLTWVPVKLYSVAEGGLEPPTFAPNEVYPFRWEVEIDGVFLDGNRLPDSTVPSTIADASSTVSVLIDTGNSLIRGPTDVVTNILNTVSPAFAASNNLNTQPTLPCSAAHSLAFSIGGKMFPVDPRDFISPLQAGNARTCVADNVVSTDAPSVGALFSWSLGDPFLKSNLVAFHYGNLTHPSQDPPRIGFLSNVPTDAASLLTQAVQDAETNSGNFESTLMLAPTASAAAEAQVTVMPSSAVAAAAQSIISSVSSVLSTQAQSDLATSTTLAQSSSTTTKSSQKSSALSFRQNSFFGIWVAIAAFVIFLS